MAIYGANYIKFAPITSEPENAQPIYGASISLGGLEQISETPNITNAKKYANNTLYIDFNKFSEAAVSVTVEELPDPVVSTVFGAKTATEGVTTHSESDLPKSGGLGFFVSRLHQGNNVDYKGIIYLKTLPKMPSLAASTAASSLTLGSDKIDFTAQAANNGEWKLEKVCATETLAKAWIDSILNLPSVPI